MGDDMSDLAGFTAIKVLPVRLPIPQINEAEAAVLSDWARQCNDHENRKRLEDLLDTFVRR